MPGSQRNSWSSYLNGGTAQYNFSYNDDKPSDEPMPESHQMPSIPQPPSEKKKNIIVNTSPQPISEPINKKQSGGKRKSRHRRSQKHRRTYRK